MGINIVKYRNSTLVDLTPTSATASDVASGKVFFDKSGTQTTGTASGGGGKNIQAYMGQSTTNQTSYTATSVKLKVAKTGTYKVSWSGFRNTTSGTSGSQLYIDGTAYGSATTTFTNSYGQNVILNDVSLTAGQEIVVRARARNTSYYMGVSNLIIEEQ